MPGSGKSYWLSHFAKALQLPNIDLDAFIETEYGQTIPEIMARGLLYFRKKEATSLQKILHNKTNCVLATGGGTPCFGNNLSMMKQAGVVLYIKCSTELLQKRLQHSTIHRPLLRFETPDELYTVLKETFHKRKAFYEQSDITFDPSVDHFEKIIQQIQQKNAKRFV